MNKIFKKNQLIITSLAIMIAVAGYLNFSGEEISMLSGGQETMVQSVKDELEIPEGEIGEAVLTSAAVPGFVADARLNREQIHAKAKERSISTRTVNEAKSRIPGIVTKKIGKGWFWAMPGRAGSPDEDCNIAVSSDDKTEDCSLEEDVAPCTLQCCIDENDRTEVPTEELSEVPSQVSPLSVKPSVTEGIAG
jgi:stage III sporulation protein AH